MKSKPVEKDGPEAAKLESKRNENRGSKGAEMKSRPVAKGGPERAKTSREGGIRGRKIGIETS